MKQIKLISAIERTPVTSLQGMKHVSRYEVRLPEGISWEPVEIKPHAVLSVSDKVEDRCTVWTARLTFKTCQDLDGRGRWAYRCRLLGGGRYRLVGCADRPYPTATVQENMPENVTDNQLNEVTVSWQSPRFIPYIAE